MLLLPRLPPAAPATRSTVTSQAGEPAAKEELPSLASLLPGRSSRSRSKVSDVIFENYLAELAPGQLSGTGPKPMTDSTTAVGPLAAEGLPGTAAVARASSEGLAGTASGAHVSPERLAVTEGGPPVGADTAVVAPTQQAPQGPDLSPQTCPSGEGASPVRPMEPPIPGATPGPVLKDKPALKAPNGPAADTPGEMNPPNEDRSAALLQELLPQLEWHTGSMNPDDGPRAETAKPRDSSPRPERVSLPGVRDTALPSGHSRTDLTADVAAQSPARGPEEPQRIPAVVQQIATNIVARAEVVASEGRTDLHIRLDPPELGTVQVHLIASQQTILARFVVHNEATHQLLTSHLQSLRQTLENAGVSLGSFDVLRGGTGSQETWQQSQQRPQPGPDSAPTDAVRPKPALPERNGSPVPAGRIDVVA
jgi:hypothetical protein